jgi:hypothetical protein
VESKKENFLNTPLFSGCNGIYFSLLYFILVDFLRQGLVVDEKWKEMKAGAYCLVNFYWIAGSALLLCLLTDSDGQTLLRVSATDG